MVSLFFFKDILLIILGYPNNLILIFNFDIYWVLHKLFKHMGRSDHIVISNERGSRSYVRLQIPFLKLSPCYKLNFEMDIRLYSISLEIIKMNMVYFYISIY